MRVNQTYLVVLMGFDGHVCLYISANRNIRGSSESIHVPITEEGKRDKDAHWSGRRETCSSLIGQSDDIFMVSIVNRLDVK